MLKCKGKRKVIKN